MTRKDLVYVIAITHAAGVLLLIFGMKSLMLSFHEALLLPGYMATTLNIMYIHHCVRLKLLGVAPSKSLHVLFTSALIMAIICFVGAVIARDLQ